MTALSRTAAFLATLVVALAAAPVPAAEATVHMSCTPPQYNGTYPPNAAWTMCTADTPFWAFIVGRCGSAQVSHSGVGARYEGLRLEVQCYDYATLTGAFTGIGPMGQA